MLGMAALPNISTFQYQKLPDATSYIRLLEVLEFNENQAPEVVCRLSVFPLATAPTYHAMSYTWGDLNDTRPLSINDKHIEVRRNCEYVLKQAKWYSDSQRPFKKNFRYFWCDAICINQADHNEKGQQVQIMGEIYKKAKRTLSCVGEHADNSELLMSSLQSTSLLLEALSRARHSKPKNRLGPSYDKLDFHTTLSRLWLRWRSTSALLDVCRALEVFVQ